MKRQAEKDNKQSKIPRLPPNVQKNPTFTPWTPPLQNKTNNPNTSNSKQSKPVRNPFLIRKPSATITSGALNKIQNKPILDKENTPKTGNPTNKTNNTQTKTNNTKGNTTTSTQGGTLTVTNTPSHQATTTTNTVPTVNQTSQTTGPQPTTTIPKVNPTQQQGLPQNVGIPTPNVGTPTPNVGTPTQNVGTPTPTNSQQPTTSKNIKQEKQAKTTNPNTIPITGRLREHRRLKNEGLIRVSLYGVEVYTKPEIQCILNTLGARQHETSGPGFITALVRTGIYTHANNTLPATGDMELGPVIEQGTQVKGTDIDDEIYAHNIQKWKPLVTETPLIDNPQTIPSTIKPAEVVFNQKAFINYTPYPIPEDVGVILSMGPKFAVPVFYKKGDFNNLKQAAFMLNEAYGNTMEELDIRANIMAHIEEYKEKEYLIPNIEVRDYFHAALEHTQRFTETHPDIIVTQSDKARSTIIMMKQDYLNKGENLLKDETTYKLLQPKATSTAAYIKLNEKILTQMLDMGLITKRDKNEALRTENKPANVYFLIKNHKPNAPVRPIVNTRNSMFYTAAKVVTRILNKARDSGGNYNVTNSRQACEQLRNLKICPDEKLYSLDIVQMFTNIPVERAISAVKKRQQVLGVDNPTLQIIIKVITHVCKISTEIAFNNKIYKQIRGLRMGSSLSPILADFVVEDMLDTAFIKIQRPVLLIKYVDDILTILQTDKAQDFVNALNSIDEHIKFEMETEENGVINYLDFTVYNDGWDTRTKWYQKHISSGQFLNYHSHHSRSNKWHTTLQYVITMILNSHESFWEEIYITAMDRLTRNSYPKEYAKKVIDTAKERVKNEHSIVNPTVPAKPNEQNPPAYTEGLPYIPNLTEKIRREIITSAATQPEPRNINIPSIPIYKMGHLVYNQHKNSNKPDNANEVPTEASLDLTQHDPQPNP